MSNNPESKSSLLRMLNEIQNNILKLQKEEEIYLAKKKQMDRFLSNCWGNKLVHKFLFEKLHNYNGHCFTVGGSRDSDTESVSSESEVYRLGSLLLKENVVHFAIRNGKSNLICTTSIHLFPQMVIVGYLNDKDYGRKELGTLRNVWECNEILDITI